MTTPDDRPFDDDRRMTADDRDALDPDRRMTDPRDPGRTTGLGESDLREGDRTTDLRDTERTTDLGESDRMTDDRTADYHAGDRTTDFGDTERTTNFREGDRTTGLPDADRTTGLPDADRTTAVGDGDPTTRRDGDLREPGTDWSAAPTTGATAGTTADDRSTATDPLVAEDQAVDFRTRWEVIQQGFVDDPRNSVSEADKLVDDLLKRLSMSFEQQHQDLEKQWSDGEPSTEDLRAALQKYRAFFQRLLAM
jgi:hypothetical protein